MAYVNIPGATYATCPEHQSILVDQEFVTELHKVKLSWTPQGYCSISAQNPDGTVLREQLHNYIFKHLCRKSIPKGLLLHHVNEKKWDNRLQNLELTTYAHNSAAVWKKTEKSSSIYKGVHFEGRCHKWHAQIHHGKHNIFLGYFEQEVEAAKAYDTAYVALHRSKNGTNNTLDEATISHILDNPEGYLPKAKRADRKLPKNISTRQNSFRVTIERKGATIVRKNFPTLEQAIVFRDGQLRRLEIEREEKLRQAPIARDSEGIAIIPVKQFKCSDTLYTRVADEDYYNLVKWKWYLNKRGYVWSPKGGEMHTFLINNSDSSKVVDHANHDKLDNQRENLRVVSRSFNARNKRKREGCSSKYVGVRYYKQTDKWQARIKHHGKEKHLGYFFTEEEAHLAYQKEYKAFENAETSI